MTTPYRRVHDYLFRTNRPLLYTVTGGRSVVLTHFRVARRLFFISSVDGTGLQSPVGEPLDLMWRLNSSLITHLIFTNFQYKFLFINRIFERLTSPKIFLFPILQCRTQSIDFVTEEGKRLPSQTVPLNSSLFRPWTPDSPRTLYCPS